MVTWVKKFKIKKGGNNVLLVLFGSSDYYYSLCFCFVDIMVDTPVILRFQNEGVAVSILYALLEQNEILKTISKKLDYIELCTEDVDEK